MFNRKSIKINKIAQDIAFGILPEYLATITKNQNLKIRLNQLENYFDLLPKKMSILEEFSNQFLCQVRENKKDYIVNHFNKEDLEYLNEDGTCGNSYTLIENDGYACGSSNEIYPREEKKVFIELNKYEISELWKAYCEYGVRGFGQLR